MTPRRVKENAINVVPDVQLDLHLSSFASVTNAVKAACLEGGTMFTSESYCDYNAFYVPLIGIAEQMKAVIWAVDRWAFRAKYMKHIDTELAYIYHQRNLANGLRFAKIARRLDRCSPYDSSYRRVFHTLIARLDILADAANTLITFISSIVAEGTYLTLNAAARTEALDHESTISDKNPDDTTSAGKSDIEHDVATKIAYLGAAELDVFTKTLSCARDARRDITKAMITTNEVAILADDMQLIFDTWAERCEMWEIECSGEAEVAVWEE